MLGVIECFLNKDRPLFVQVSTFSTPPLSLEYPYQYSTFARWTKGTKQTFCERANVCLWGACFRSTAYEMTFYTLNVSRKMLSGFARILLLSTLSKLQTITLSGPEMSHSLFPIRCISHLRDTRSLPWGVNNYGVNTNLSWIDFHYHAAFLHELSEGINLFLSLSVVCFFSAANGMTFYFLNVY